MGHLHDVPKFPTGLGAGGRPQPARETEFSSTRLAPQNTLAAQAGSVQGWTRSPRTQIVYTRVPGEERWGAEPPTAAES